VHVPARLHLWPWSCASPEETEDLPSAKASFDFFGSPVISLVEEAEIYLPSRHERFHPLGPAFALSKGRCRLFEMPHGMLAGVMYNGAGFSVHSKAGGEIVRDKVVLSFEGVVPRHEKNAKGEQAESALARTVKSWSNVFDKLLDEARQANKLNESLEWLAVRNHLQQMKEEEKEPLRAVIVDIAKTMHRPLPETVRAARRVLLRERRLLPACRVEETDSACLHWYIRQPGLTTAEKAGPRQRLLGVARQETYNLHENRILKDFLSRCAYEGRQYVVNAITDNPAFRTASNVQEVQTLGTLCTQLLTAPSLEDVTDPNPATPPNYVLLNDMRYRRVWYWYQKLLHQELEKDRFWDWQSRTWADISRMLVSVAIILHLEQLAGSGSLRLSALYGGALRIRGEQALGCRTAAGSETGPLLVERRHEGKPNQQAILEIVHPEQADHHPIVRHLGATGGHLYLVLRPLPPAKKAAPQILIVWAAHTAASAQRIAWNDVYASAVKALHGHQTLLHMDRIPFSPTLHGLVLCSRLDANIHSEEGADNLVLVSVPASPMHWIDALSEDIILALDKLIGKMMYG